MLSRYFYHVFLLNRNLYVFKIRGLVFGRTNQMVCTDAHNSLNPRGSGVAKFTMDICEACISSIKIPIHESSRIFELVARRFEIWRAHLKSPLVSASVNRSGLSQQQDLANKKYKDLTNGEMILFLNQENDNLPSQPHK